MQPYATPLSHHIWFSWNKRFSNSNLFKAHFLNLMKNSIEWLSINLHIYCGFYTIAVSRYTSFSLFRIYVGECLFFFEKSANNLYYNDVVRVCLHLAIPYIIVYVFSCCYFFIHYKSGEENVGDGIEDDVLVFFLVKMNINSKRWEVMRPTAAMAKETLFNHYLHPCNNIL